MLSVELAHKNAHHHLEELRKAARHHDLITQFPDRPTLRTRVALSLQTLAHRLEPELTLPRPANQPSPKL